MLQFWKKSGSKDKVEKSSKNTSPSKLPKSSPIHHPSNGDIAGVPSYHTGIDTFLSLLKDEDIASSIAGLSKTPRSQLSKSLAEVLTDKGALGYFIQYLDAQGQLSLVKFWLDVESFRAAASTRSTDSFPPVTAVTREQLELLDDPSRLSPQQSQGTDCDLFESPSHSFDSCDSTFLETTGDRTSCNNIHESTSISSSKIIDKEESNDLSSIRRKASKTKIGLKIRDVKDDSPVSLTDNAGEHCVHSSNLTEDCKKKAICDTNVLERENVSSQHGASDHITISTNTHCSSLDNQGLDKIKCTSRFSDNVPQPFLSNIHNKIVNSISLDHRCVEVESTVKTISDSETPLSSTASPLPLPDNSSEKRSVTPCFSGNVHQAVVEDAVRIYGKYLSLRSVFKIPIDSDVRERVILSICKDDGLVDSEAFSEAQGAIFFIMESDYFRKFLQSDFHCKHQIDVLTSGKVTMADILYNETALFYFMEFMEQEGNRHLVEFWLAAINFQQHLQGKKGSFDPVEAQNDAIILYDKYFSLQATCPLGFGDQVRFAVEQDICRDEGPLPECFQRPISMVQHVLQKNFLQPFLTSQLHFKYLSELMNTIQASPALLTKNRKSGSECSSDWSISVQNTLLATEDSTRGSNKSLQSVGGKDLSIDSNQLNDPDSLWKRRHHRGLSFGRINHMGRFETDVEPEPDRKEESRITKVVKKLVNMEEDKAKEEMAWQIAEMIINDITSLTLGSSESVQS